MATCQGPVEDLALRATLDRRALGWASVAYSPPPPSPGPDGHEGQVSGGVDRGGIMFTDLNERAQSTRPEEHRRRV